MQPTPGRTGQVTLAAAGLGDAELLPVRSARALASAQVVFADAVVRDLAEQLSDGEVVVVEGRGSELAVSARAKEIAKVAQSGRAVVRLLAGDPVLDGSFTQEAGALDRLGILYDYVPCVSLVSGLAAFAGVGLTNQQAVEVRFIDANQVASDWSEHAADHLTLVIRNGADQSVAIANALVAAGRDPATPVLVTRDAASICQRTVAATLGSLPAAAKAAGHVGSGHVIVGPSAERETLLSWYEGRPLFGWRVLLPSTKDSVAELVAGLQRLGASVTQVPTMMVEPPRTPQLVDKAVKGLVSGRFEWVVFTCPNSVKAVWQQLLEYGLDARAFSGLRVAACGDGTAEALAAFGIAADLAVAGSTTELLGNFPDFDALVDPFNRVFLPRADIATESLASGLTERGWEVEDVTAYRTMRAAPPAEPIRQAIKAGDFDAVVFTSSATVRNLVGIAGKPHAVTAVICIGEKTAQTAEEHGLRPSAIAEEPNFVSLLDTLAYYGSELRDAALAAGETHWRPARRRATSRRKANQ